MSSGSSVTPHRGKQLGNHLHCRFNSQVPIGVGFQNESRGYVGVNHSMAMSVETCQRWGLKYRVTIARIEHGRPDSRVDPDRVPLHSSLEAALVLRRRRGRRREQ